MSPLDEQDVEDGTKDEPLLADSVSNDPEEGSRKHPVPINSSGHQDEQPISLMSDLWLVVSIITFLADLGSDLLVSVQYYSEHNYWYFGLTLGFVSVASIILQIFSAKWFYDDGKKPMFKIFILHLLQMGPLSRYWSAIKLCWMSRHGGADRAEERFVSEWRDLCMLKLLEAFLHSAPQCVFQLFVLTRRNPILIGDDIIIAIAAITSLVSVVWSLVCYSKALRDLRDNARDLPWFGFTCQVLWRGFMITSRIVALVLFASYFQLWMLVAVAGHWFLMALWLSCQRTQFCIDDNGREHPCKEKMFNSIIAFIYVFCFFNTKEGMTRKRIVLYYSVMLVENSLLISMWYPNRTLNTTMTYVALATVWGGFVLGVVFMILYYRFYHHSHTFKGIFLRKRRFTLHGRKLYGLYFCCCFRIKKWELGLYDVNSDPQLIMNRDLEEHAGEVREMDLEAFPHVNSQQGNLYWDNDDIQMKPLNGAYIKGGNKSPESAPLLQNAQSAREDSEEVPDIVITAASPLALSPRDSHSSLIDQHEKMNSELTCTCEKCGEPFPPNQPPVKCPVDKAKQILASKLHKAEENDDEVFHEDEDIPKINYGSVSFGNRYSLVSSDCISLSSESSISSFTSSVNDLLDRMSFSAKANYDPEGKGPKTSTTDEGIFSDERESPTKPSSNEADSLVNHQKDIKNKVKLIETSAVSPNSSKEKDEEDVIASIMDAPPSPVNVPKKVVRAIKEEVNESDSTDGSSDGTSNDYNRRHSYNEISSGSFANEDDTVNKRHSFDIAELSRKPKRAKKNGKNRKRLNNIITFDNFVSSPLKAGRFGSLRKSFERLSKIQEDREEVGLLSDEVLTVIQKPPQDKLPSNDGEPSTAWLEEKKNVDIKPEKETESSRDDVDPETTRVETRVVSPVLWVKQEQRAQKYQRNLDDLKRKQKHAVNCYEKDKDFLLEEKDKGFKVETRPLNEEYSATPFEEPSKESSDDIFIFEELTPSRFSTVRRSRESVPLACLEDFDDLDDLCTDSDSMHDADERASASPTTHAVCTPKASDIYATDSNVSESIKDRSMTDFGSSSSSIFENLLYLETEHSSLDEVGRLNKRHTYDFGSDRIGRQGKVKRLGSSSSQRPIRTPGSPVWVQKAIFKHRRRKPKPLPQTDFNKSDSAIRYIQEIRV